MKILFVCTGNICRSPVAAAHFRRCVAEIGWRHVTADSAGTHGLEGAPACPEVVVLTRELGLELGGHRSKRLQANLLAGVDWTVVMEHDHLAHLARHHVRGRDRRVLLRAFELSSLPSPDAEDLEDPFGGPTEGYRRQVPLILRCVEHFVAHLQRK